MSIATELTRIQGAKADLKTSIEAKGVTVPSSTTIDGYASLVDSINEIPAWMKDGNTHLWIDIKNDAQKAQQLCIRMIGNIDWGDGTVESVSVTTPTTFNHTYANKGKYRIDLKPSSGTFFLGGNANNTSVMGGISSVERVRAAALYQVEIGKNIINRLTGYAFYYCYGLLKIYIPKTITRIDTYAFGSNLSLKEIEFEDHSTIATASNALFSYCNCLQKLPIDILTSSNITNMSVMYRTCYCLIETTIPSTVTTLGNYAYQNCMAMEKIHCLPTTPPTASGTSVFAGLNPACVIEVPSGSLAAYQAATGWSDISSQIVGV